MKTVAVETAKLSALVADVRAGEEVVLTDHERPVARLVPVRRTPPRATPEMLRARKQALHELRALGGLRDIIADPAAWQREIRQDRPLPGRE
ncbi:MAG: type II toxin-antitoxin system prevent-host-death family antitoxin [Verrucomicrobia bacterium]|nr:type II toxin-antitoxin system prevent-host-death family antitoxin [Verrucomicrobiota bacterium]